MQKWIHGATRRAAALLLGAALLTSAMVPAVPAWAQEPGETQTASVAGQTPENAESDGGETASAPQKEDAAKQTPANAEASGEEAADGQEELILLYQPGDGEQQTLKDGAVLDSFSSWSFGEMSLCRGDENNPVLKADTTVQLISHATGQEIPTEVMRATELNDNYAVYNFWVINGEAEADYFAGISPDFAFDIVFTAGDESLTVTVENKGVEVAVSAGPNQVNQVGQDQYQVDLGVRSVSSPSLEGFQANPGWVISQPTLSGDLAGYFTLGDFTQEGVQLNPTEALAALPDYTMVEGTLNYVSKLDGQSYSSVLQYTKSSTWLSWCYWDGQPQNGWVDEPSITLSEGQKGSLQLRLYPSMLPPDEGGTPISLTQEELSYDLPQGITARLLDDQTTLQLEYDLSSADVRDAVYWVCAQPASGGIYRFNISVLGAEKYALARYISGDKYEYTDIHYPYIDMSSLRENYALIPLSDGKPATTREELANSVLRVEDEEHPGSFQMVARQVQYQDKEGNTSTVWAWAIMPIVEMTEPSNPMEKRTFSIYDSQDTLLGQGSYSISGAGGTALQADHMETLSVGENTSMAQKFYSVQDEAGQPLVLTEAPQVTGEAAQSISVIWAPGLSSIRVDFNSDQVPGEVQVELRSGDTVRRLLYHFRAFQESALYYSTGTDFYHRSYTESLALTESLSGLSSGIVQPVNTTRFAEDGSFELYLYSRQYISDKLQDTADHLASKYSFASELVKSIRFVSSDEEILKIDGEISQSQAVDPVFSGNGYSNPEGKCFGVRLTPGGKAGSCDVYAEIELNRPSLNDPFGCDMEKTPEKVTIGYTFTVQKDTSGQEITANPDTLQQVLEDITIGSEPTVVVLEGGEYPMDLNLDGKNLILRSADPENPAVFTGASGAQGGFIITVNSPSPSFALEGLVLDGKGVRGGILQKDTGGDPSIGFTVQDCTIRNCTTGIQGYIGNNCVVKNTTIENCELGVTGCALSYCTLKNNTCAAQEDYYSNIRQ